MVGDNRQRQGPTYSTSSDSSTSPPSSAPPEPPPTRRLVRLRDRYPDCSRMTRWRMRQEPDFPDAVVIRRREWFVEAELVEYEEQRRRRSSAAQRERAST